MWLNNLKLVLPDKVVFQGSIKIEGGLIAAISTEHPGEGLDCMGLTAIPGIIDMHGDMLERELEPRPGSKFPFEVALVELDKRLASNGITTGYASISFIEGWGSRGPEEGLAIVHKIHRMRSKLRVDMKVHARFEVTTPGSAPILRESIANDEIHLVSLMDHSPGQGQFRDLEHYISYYSKWIGGEKESEIRGKAVAMMDAPRAWHIAKDVADICTERKVPLASHDDDTAQKIDLMAGLGVGISEFPVTLEAAREAKQKGMAVIMGAPNAMRGSSHSGNLSAVDAIAEGLVDGLAADYHPATLIQCAFGLAESGLLTLPQSVKMVSENIAKMCGLKDRGRLAVGLSADIVLVEEGIAPRVRRTILRGETIYDDGTLIPL